MDDPVQALGAASIDEQVDVVCKGLWPCLVLLNFVWLYSRVEAKSAYEGLDHYIEQEGDRGSPWPVPSMRMKGSDLLPLTSRIIWASLSNILTRLMNFSGTSRYLRIFSSALSCLYFALQAKQTNLTMQKTFPLK